MFLTQRVPRAGRWEGFKLAVDTVGCPIPSWTPRAYVMGTLTLLSLIKGP